jgi:hypothetical protein
LLRRIRSLLSTPFARPPGRRSLWARFAPEWCALSVWLLFLARCWYRYDGDFTDDPITTSMLRAAPVAYGLAGMILFVLPLQQGAWAWAPERSRAAMPVLLTTSLDHQAVAWGRFWIVTLPWLRFFVCLVPIYILGASHSMLIELIHSQGWKMGMLCSFAPKPLVVWWGCLAADIPDPSVTMGFSAKAFGFLALRILRDLSAFFLSMGTAYFFSVLCRTPARAFLAALAAVVLFMFSLGALDIWWVVLLRYHPIASPSGVVIAATIACSLILAQMVLPLLLVGWAARRFDAWALGEKA